MISVWQTVQRAFPTALSFVTHKENFSPSYLFHFVLSFLKKKDLQTLKRCYLLNLSGVEPHKLRQGMTIRPGAGNLLGRAGEHLSGLPDWEVVISFLSFLLTV